jgi:chemotaxis receptor (MCP) glutamine deamidase CheD
MNAPQHQKTFSCYHDRRFDREAVKLLPGDYFACGGEKMLVTVLGSCISVCLFESKLKIGGMNHFMLPSTALKKGFVGIAKHQLGPLW